MEINTVKAFNYVFIFITILFIISMGLEVLNCLLLVKSLNAPDPAFSDTSFKYLIGENKALIDRIVRIVRWSTFYGIAVLFYLGFRR